VGSLMSSAQAPPTRTLKHLPKHTPRESRSETAVSLVQQLVRLLTSGLGNLQIFEVRGLESRQVRGL